MNIANKRVIAICTLCRASNKDTCPVYNINTGKYIGFYLICCDSCVNCKNRCEKPPEEPCTHKLMALVDSIEVLAN